MYIFSRQTTLWLAFAVLAVSIPVVRVRAQAAAGQPAAPGAGGRGRGGNVPQGDYNAAKRSDEDKALPNPYYRNEAWFTFEKGRALGSASGIDVDKDGKSIWVTERCGGQDLCIGNHVPPVIKFDANGKIVKMFGADMIVYPHGLHVDRDGNIWIADLQSNVDRSAGRGGATAPPAAGLTANGAQVLKFTPEGKLLLRLGVPGVYGTDDTHFSQPSAVITAANGDIFVADGHDSPPSNNRITKFDKTGKFIKAWGKSGTETGEFDCPHGLAMDSQGRLFVADRGNNRIQIFDQDGNFIAEWKQFGKPSGVYIDKNDILYAADSESSVRQGNAYVRGVHVGSAKTGVVTAFIPDPLGNPTPWFPLRGTTGSEGVVADKDGIIYVSQVTPPGLAKYTRKPQ